MPKNWLGMKAHQVDNWAFWKTKQNEHVYRREQYDRITANMTDEQKKELNSLIDWARDEAISDQQYSAGDC